MPVTDTDGTTTRYRDLWAPPTDSSGPRRRCVPDMGGRFGVGDDEPDVRVGGLPTRRHDSGGAGVAGPGRDERSSMPDRHGILALVEGQCQSRPQRGRLPGSRTPVREAAHVEAVASVGVGPVWLHHVPPFGVVCPWRPGLAHQLRVNASCGHARCKSAGDKTVLLRHQFGLSHREATWGPRLMGAL